MSSIRDDNRWGSWLPLALAGVVGTTACTSSQDAGEPMSQPPGMPVACDEGPVPGPAPLRLLTRAQYNNTVRDLLGDASSPANGFPAEATVEGFENNAELHRANPRLVNDYQTAAETVAEGAIARGLADYLPCGFDAADPYACGQEFVRRFTTAAFRRPPTDEELASFGKLLETTRQAHDFQTAVQWVVEAALQSPQFLYRVDAPLAPTAESGAMPIGSWEMASRLSYLLWNSMPDQRLFDLAGENALEAPEQIALEAHRMLEDPRARGVVIDFHRQWLGLDGLTGIAREAPEYGTILDRLPTKWRASVDAFIDHVFWDEGGSLEALLLSPTVFVDDDLAEVYGVSGGSEDALRAVQFDPAERAGLLTQPGILSLLAHPDQSSPVRRGVFVRERILCEPLPDPPPNVDTTPPDPSPNLTTRQRFAEHTRSADCAVCHARIDGIGFGFENYDALGRYRATEQGLPVDAAGSVFGARDPALDGAFTGAIELSHRLAQSQQVQRCVATQWYRYAFGRIETAEDGCSLERVQDAFSASNGNFRELLVGLTQTDAFLFRPPNAEDL